ncbi:MAG: glutamate--cysteine ligase [Alphaproteobacteria bacterium]
MFTKMQLVESLAKGCKPKEKWRIGCEHEKFVYHKDDFSPLLYKDKDGRAGIYDILQKFSEAGWQPIEEDGNLIALKDDSGASVTLEPAGQFELSGAPLENVHQVCRETSLHLKLARSIGNELGIAFLGLGYQPIISRQNLPWMPKSRYNIMKNYMPKVGRLGLDMMQATCTVQVNLDFDSEATMIKMFRTSLALQPIATALWANSPFKDGKPSGYLSYRARIWQDTDNDRCGLLPFVFEDDFSFERYVDYLLDVPMYFIYREGQYIDATGYSFKQFLEGNHPNLKAYEPSLKDFEDHATTVFPEVRLKTFLEMRGADGSSWHRICALPAFWVGLLYDEQSLNTAYDMISDWTLNELSYLRETTPKLALNTPFRGQTLQKYALDILKLSHNGLARRGILNKSGSDETVHLAPLMLTAESGITPAEAKLYAYENFWNHDLTRIYRELAY